MPLMLPISSVTSCGISSAAARSSELFREPARRLPESPRIVVMTLTSRQGFPVYAHAPARELWAVFDGVADRPPAANVGDERIGGARPRCARLVDMRRVGDAQQRIDDSPRLEHSVLASEQRTVVMERCADQPLIGSRFVGARVADEQLEVAADHL